MNRVLFIIVLAWVAHFAQAQNITLAKGFAQIMLLDKMNPTALAVDPSGNVYAAQKDGRVLFVAADGTVQKDPVISLQVDDFNERGLGGIALHPDFENQPWMYLYYTVPGADANRLSRFRINGSYAMPGSEEVLYDFDQLGGYIHNGGGMAFGIDGKLYVGSGDGAQPANGQNMNTSLSKIIRLNPDGTIPADNPYYAGASGKLKAIYATGVRNPFSMAVHPATGRLFVCDVGGGAYEEINEIYAGKNYGWSVIEGPATTQNLPANYQNPFYGYDHALGCAIVGAAFSTPGNFPDRFRDKFLFADYCAGRIYSVDINSGLPGDTLAVGIKQPVAMAFNPSDGTFYYIDRSGIGGGSVADNTTSSDGTLWKVYYTGTGAPKITYVSPDVYIPENEDAGFIVQASGDAPLVYRWQKNGVEIPGADAPALLIPGVNQLDNGAQFRCIVQNAFGADTSAAKTLFVLKNHRPEPYFMSPAAGFTYKAGDVIMLSGGAQDPEDGQLSEANLNWRVDLHHDTHVHPALGTVFGTEETEFVVPSYGETSTHTWFRIYLTAKDSEGLEKTVFRDIYPELTTIRIEGPEGVPINVDGAIRNLPYTFESLKGQSRTLQAVPYSSVGDTVYEFREWKENPSGGQFYTFFAPVVNGVLTIHARYSTYPLGNGTGLHGEYFIDPEFDLDETPAVLHLDTVINFNWGNGSPFPQIPGNGFTVRWSGFVQSVFSEIHTFYIRSDDGARLWVNDSLIIDKWKAQPATEYAGNIFLSAGKKTRIKLEYMEIGGGAEVSLQWSSGRTRKALVPKRQLYPPPPYEPATIKGIVWRDANYNKIQDAGEGVLSGATVMLYDGIYDTLMAVQETDLLGRYKFYDLTPGDYYLRVIPAPANVDLHPIFNVDLAGQTPILSVGPLVSLSWNIAFGLPPASIYGKSWHDLNADGIFQSGEPPLSQITVLLFARQDSLLLDVMLTDAQGNYQFSYLPEDSYFLQFSNALNGQGLTPGAGLGATGLSSIWTLVSGQNALQNAPFIDQSGAVQGRIWHDLNGNYFPDVDDPGLEKVTILLHTEDSVFVAHDISAADGSYLFTNITPGTYYLLLLTNAIPLALEPAFGVNVQGQSPFFVVQPGKATVVDAAFKTKISSQHDPGPYAPAFRFFPNPGSAFFRIEYSGRTLPALQIRIWNTTGNIVFEGASESAPPYVSVEHLPRGIYIVEASNAETRFRGKWIKE